MGKIAIEHGQYSIGKLFPGHGLADTNDETICHNKPFGLTVSDGIN